MNRKDEHINYALKYESVHNSFDEMELIHCSIPEYNIEDIDISVNFAGNKFECPFFINAMTGGSQKGKEINRKLAKIAEKCNLLFVTGSYSAALKNPHDSSFKIVREENKNLLLGTNIGADKDYKAGLKAIEDLNPLFLQIHVNLMQELIMSEGSRNFSKWQENIKGFTENIKIPLILKEVGFGMSEETIKKGMELGIKTFDISGRGGTSFAYIENARRKNTFPYLNDWGQTTVVSLLSVKKYMEDVEIIASGGIRNPLDIIKSLVLGAKGAGISRTILKLIEESSVENVIEIMNSWKNECKMIMCALNCKNIDELKNVKYILYGKTREAQSFL